MPFHLHNIEFKNIELSVPKEKVNNFLSNLWSDFNKTIGRVSCQHSYLDTKDSEIYEYNICWADGDLPFIAELSFYNHTAKGLIYVLLAVVDYKTKEPNDDFQKKIIESIKRTSIIIKNDIIIESIGYLKIPLHTKYKISGNYRLDDSNIIILANKYYKQLSCHIIFPIFSNNSREAQYEGMSKIVDIASVLTTLTQNLFCVDESNRWEFINKKEFLLLCSKTKFSGVMIPDDGMIDKIEFFSDDGAKIFIDDQQKTKEIIEERDCIIDNCLCLPERVDAILKIIIIEENDKLQQSCRRFHEALMLRNNTKQRTPSTIHYSAYELLAYVASIEALLDTKVEKMKVNCPNCDEIIYKEEWKIAVKFRDFIDKYGDNNPVFNKVYKNLYSDRSRFVHTGINLHSLNSIRLNRPLILKGKNFVNELPDYYHNIHKYTGFILRKHLYSKLFCELPKL